MTGQARQPFPLKPAVRFLAADRVLQVGLGLYLSAFLALFLSTSGFGVPAEAARNLLDPVLVGLTPFALVWGRSRVAPDERRFWDLLALAWSCWLIVELIYFFELETPLVSASFMADALYFVYYFLFAVAVDLRPHLSSLRSLTAMGRRLEAIAGLVAIFGLLIYFALVILPDPLGVSLSFVSREGGFTPLLLVRISLDLLILARLVFAAFTAAGRWRTLYALLAGGMLGYAMRDTVSLLRYEEILSVDADLMAQAILNLPGLVILVAARCRLVPTTLVEAPRAEAGVEESPVHPRPSPIALYALLVPGLHFLLYPLGFLDAASRVPREIFCLGYVAVLGGLAWVHERVLAEDNRLARAALRQAEDRLSSSRKLEAVGRLAGGIAHDFNNYLTVIRGYCDVLRERLTGPAERADLEYIADAANKATHLTRQLLAFGRRQVLHPEALDLNSVVRDTGRMLTSLLGEDVVLEMDLDPLAGLAKADLGQTEQLLVNLALNGRDAMPHGGTLSIHTGRTELAPEEASKLEVEPGSYVTLVVVDTGTGMSDEVRKQAFEPFFTTKELGRGTGLGLSTVYGVVTQSGGAITVDSRLGKGTSFNVVLPSASASPAAEQPPAQPVRREQGRENILLVEDEEAVRRLVSLSLGRAGFHVCDARDGADAVARFLEDCESLDLLITDVMMPGMDGVELATIFQERCPGLRVLFLSGYPAVTLRQRHKLLPLSLRLLEKPFSPRRLVEVVNEVLDDSAPIPSLAGVTDSEEG